MALTQQKRPVQGVLGGPRGGLFLRNYQYMRSPKGLGGSLGVLLGSGGSGGVRGGVGGVPGRFRGGPGRALGKGHFLVF